MVGVSLLGLCTVLSGLESGGSAPDFSLDSSAGATVRLSQYRGKYVVLEWTNHRCPFVKKFYRGGHMQAMQKELVDAGVIWLQILSSAPGKQGYLNASDAESLRKLQQHQTTALLLDPDGAVGRQYDARTTPHVFLINPEGVVLYQGAIDSIASTRTEDIKQAENYSLTAYSQALSGSKVARPATKPYGCSIKY